MGTLTNDDILNYLPNINSSDAEWITYYKKLEKLFSKGEAKTVWNKTWVERGNDDANTYELRSFLLDKGIKLEGTGWFDNMTDSFKSDLHDFDIALRWAVGIAILIAFLVAFYYSKKMLVHHG